MNELPPWNFQALAIPEYRIRATKIAAPNLITSAFIPDPALDKERLGSSWTREPG
jgi:hypothetical protein